MIEEMQLVLYSRKYREIAEHMCGAAFEKLTNAGMYKILALLGLYKSSYFLYANNEGDVFAGGGCIRKFNPKSRKMETWIAGIYVLERFRCQKYGTKLMTALLESCDQKRYEKVYLYVDNGNVSARRLYDKLGFLVVGTYKHYMKMQYSFQKNK